MKIIDEKGRLFGKLNLIDLAVVLVIILAAVALIWKFGGQKAVQTVTAKPIRVTYTVLCEDVPADVCAFADSQIDEKLVNSGKILDATLIDVATSEAEDADSLDLYLTVDASASFTEQVYKVGSQDVRVGLEYIFKTAEFELTGIVSNMEVNNG